MVLFIDIFGSSWDLPKNVSCACHDINQDIASKLEISEDEAFDINREEFLSDYGISISNANKHNSLHDAIVIKSIYECL